MAFQEPVQLCDVRARHVRAVFVQGGEGARDVGVGEGAAGGEEFAASMYAGGVWELVFCFVCFYCLIGWVGHEARKSD